MFYPVRIMITPEPNDLASKKNGHPGFSEYPLRRRTDEEIIRFIIRLTYPICKTLAKSNQKRPKYEFIMIFY